MSSAITFYFKDIFPSFADFQNYFGEYDIEVDLNDANNLTFAKYLYKILYRQYHNSNVQYDTPDDFKCDLANIIENEFERYAQQISLIQNIHNLTPAEIQVATNALASSANNPNTEQLDPTQWLSYVGSQAYTQTQNGKLQAYLLAVKNIPNKLVGEFLTACSGLFKSIIPDQIFIYKEKNENGFNSQS